MTRYMPKGKTKKQMGGGITNPFARRKSPSGSVDKITQNPKSRFSRIAGLFRRGKPPYTFTSHTLGTAHPTVNHRFVNDNDMSGNNTKISDVISEFNSYKPEIKKTRFLNSIYKIKAVIPNQDFLIRLSDDNKQNLASIIDTYYVQYEPSLHLTYKAPAHNNNNTTPPNTDNIYTIPILRSYSSITIQKYLYEILDHINNEYTDINDKYKALIASRFHTYDMYYNYITNIKLHNNHNKIFNCYNLNLYEINLLLFTFIPKLQNLQLNKSVNRYANILPNLYTRVVLKNPVKLPHNYTHIHYTAWPDHGVPTKPDNNMNYDYVMLHKIIEQLFEYKKENTPINVLVHCSAGVGRTGTFIMMCYLYNEIKITKSSTFKFQDIYKALILLRKKRNVSMVQTFIQFDYIMGYYKFLTDPPPIPPKSAKLATRFPELAGVSTTDSSAAEVDAGAGAEELSTNPYHNVTGGGGGVDGDNDYINANYIYHNNETDNPFAFFNKIIAAQGPLTTTIDDFNKMIAQEEITHVIMVTNFFDGAKNKCEKYFTRAMSHPNITMPKNIAKSVSDILFVTKDPTGNKYSNVVSITEINPPLDTIGNTNTQTVSFESIHEITDTSPKISYIIGEGTITKSKATIGVLPGVYANVESAPPVNLKDEFIAHFGNNNNATDVFDMLIDTMNGLIKRKLIEDTHCVKVKIASPTLIKFFVIKPCERIFNKYQVNIKTHDVNMSTSQNSDGMLSNDLKSKLSAFNSDNWLYTTGRASYPLQFYIYGRIPDGDTNFNINVPSDTLSNKQNPNGLTISFPEPDKYTQAKDLKTQNRLFAPCLPDDSQAGGARKYRSKKAKKTKNTKYFKSYKTKKRNMYKK